MRNTDFTNKNKFSESFWRRRPSEIRGYNRTLYTTTENNEYLRVDFNLQEKRIRLYIEDNEEGGNPYYSVITNGKITVERNATTGRVTDLSQKFSKRADIFSTIPNKDAVRLINNNYNIGINVKKSIKRNDREKNREIQLSKDRQQEKKVNYVPNYAADRERESGPRKKVKKFGLVDIIDISIGVLLCTGLYLFNHNLVALGVLSAFIGIFMGLLDVYYRERQLILLKMLLFLLAGMVFYIYGYYIL